MKQGVLTIIGAIGAFVSSIFGGWDAGLTTLVIFMAIDYLTGLIVAGVFHKSGKTENGALSSKAGLQGIVKKIMMLLMVLVAVRLDILTGTDYIRDAVIIALCGNELISIIENAGLMGVPIPQKLKEAIEVLSRKGGRVMQIQKGNFTWNGKLSPVPKEKFDSIALHHMAHPDADEYEVEKWHKGNGWVGIGYNYWIGLDGRIIEGRGLNQGAGVENHNGHIISIGFQGNYEPFDPNVKYLTEMPQAQFEAGVWLIGHLKEILPNLKYIDGHCRWNPTSCPGRYFPLKKMIDAAEKAEPQEPYCDIKGHWAESIIRQAIAEGWVKGYPDGTFQPDKPMTRAESVALVMAAIKKAPG